MVFAEYFINHMVNIMHSPFFIMDENGILIQMFGEEMEITKLYIDHPELTEKILAFKGSGVPGMFTENHRTFVVFQKGLPEKNLMVAGPIFLESVHEKEKSRQGSIYVLLSEILLIHWHLTGEELTVAEILEKNRQTFSVSSKLYEKISEDLFSAQENVEHHNPYEQELRELDSIEKGDTEALARSISETYSGEIGILAKDPLRSSKNVAVGNITLASRAAIRGGIGVEQSFSLADSFIRQVEEIDNIPEVEVFKREAQFAYARLVKKENWGVKFSKSDNPLILQVKDYVFSHLHDVIHVSDMAKELGVNPDYLSHLFSESEKIAITDYIRWEKVRRGKNLLKYSEYKIQDIAFYLGFCSQSHFSKVFQKQIGIGPGEYRKKYGNRKKWKTD